MYVAPQTVVPPVAPPPPPPPPPPPVAPVPFAAVDSYEPTMQASAAPAPAVASTMLGRWLAAFHLQDAWDWLFGTVKQLGSRLLGFLGVNQVVAPAPLPAASGGRVVVAPGAAVASHAGLAPGDGFAGRIASESLDQLKKAGGTSAAYLSPANGNREVDVLATPGFDPAKPYEVLVFVCGIKNNNARSLGSSQHIAEAMRELNAQGRNVLLVLPKSPTKMDAWFSGKEDLGALVPEALRQFSQLTGMALPAPREQWVMAHSGGGMGLRNALEKPNAPRFDRYLLADSAFGTWAARAYAALHAKQPGAQVATVVTSMTEASADTQLGRQGLRVDDMPNYRHPGHNGVPSYMIQAFLAPNPALGFSTVR